MEVKPDRLYGLDFARFLAFAGMVFVNFHIATGGGGGSAWAEIFLLSLEGKAAATFVVLAGVGLGLGAKRAIKAKFNATIIKRAGFLFGIGLLNQLIFPADILHYYAIYFIFSLFLIHRSTKTIIIAALILPVIFIIMLGVFDYEQGWNWATLEYSGFWSVDGFFRNLFYNGWHPVIPWLSFLLLGIIIARLDLYSRELQTKMVVLGSVFLVIAYALSFMFSGLDPEIAELLTVSPIPPMPLYMLAGSGAALMVIGICLIILSTNLAKLFRPFTITGKQALTLYIAHILIGMGILEALDMLHGQSAQMAVFAASMFIIASIIYANIWAKFFRAGPIEWLLRKITG